jgi:protein involved in polysaccharide export with SLBB domain
LTGAVPAQVVQLSEGVIRMMLLTKLKAATVAVLVAVGAGLGALPALPAADDPAGRPAVKADPTKPGLGPHLTDEEFLRRVCESLRGTRPSDVELSYFVADADPAKRTKVVRWLTADGETARVVEYVIEPPDVLAIEVTAHERAPETIKPRDLLPQPIRGEHVVRPDGTVGLGVYGSVPVSGATPHEAARAVRLAVARQYGELDAAEALAVVLEVTQSNSKRYYVITDGGGAGEQVQWFPATGSVTVLDALAKINYKPPVGSKQRVWVARRSPDPGRPEQVLPVDYAGITRHGVSDTNYQILPGDRVYVEADPPPQPGGARGDAAVMLFDFDVTTPPDADEAFLGRVCQDVRGGPPTAIEREYFLADQDPKKREKLLDTFLKDQAVAKKLGAEWKQKMLGTADQTLRSHYKYYLRRQAAAHRLWLKVADARPNRLETLLGQLLDGKRTDDQVLDALSAAVLGRLPTESERRLILAAVAKAPDKAAAWREVIATLGGTEEAKTHAEKK